MIRRSTEDIKMRNIIQDKLYFSFRDTDGMLSFSMNAYDGDPQNPRFLLDENGKAFLIRRVGQVIALADMQEDLCPVLQKANRIRILENPEDSSEILRQYNVPVTLIDAVSENHLLTEAMPQIA